MNTETTGAYLAMLRRARGLTQQEIANQLGVSNKTISKWESGGGFPDITVLPVLAELYGVTADDILAGETRTRAVDAPPPAGAWSTYRTQRADLRFRILAGASAILAVAGYLFNWHRTASILLVLCSILALWIGWRMATQGADRLTQLYRGWFYLILPIVTLQLFTVLWRVWFKLTILYQIYNDDTTHRLLKSLLEHTGFIDFALILGLPIVCVCVQAIYHRASGDSAPLLVRPYIGLLLVLCAVLLISQLWYTDAQMVLFDEMADAVTDKGRNAVQSRIFELGQTFRRYRLALLSVWGVSFLGIWLRRRKAALAKAVES